MENRSLHTKLSFPLRISLVNVTKSAGNFLYSELYHISCIDGYHARYYSKKYVIGESWLRPPQTSTMEAVQQ